MTGDTRRVADLPTPALVVDLDALDHNIDVMATLARARGLEVRGVMGYEGHVVGNPDPSWRRDQVATSMAVLRDGGLGQRGRRLRSRRRGPQGVRHGPWRTTSGCTSSVATRWSTRGPSICAIGEPARTVPRLKRA